ncbi:hypothetical protein EVA_11739 [gut metagenome]|uniref:Uncharacterized protein n=1 Tax=gut metagenome TaxID=749906 RepID=J9G000_9ZZZZ
MSVVSDFFAACELSDAAVSDFFSACELFAAVSASFAVFTVSDGTFSAASAAFVRFWFRLARRLSSFCQSRSMRSQAA